MKKSMKKSNYIKNEVFKFENQDLQVYTILFDKEKRFKLSLSEAYLLSIIHRFNYRGRDGKLLGCKLSTSDLSALTSEGDMTILRHLKKLEKMELIKTAYNSSGNQRTIYSRLNLALASIPQKQRGSSIYIPMQLTMKNSKFKMPLNYAFVLSTINYLAIRGKGGKCYASNDYFAKKYGLTTRTITNIINKAKKMKLITVKEIYDKKQRKTYRAIYSNFLSYFAKEDYLATKQTDEDNKFFAETEKREKEIEEIPQKTIINTSKRGKQITEEVYDDSINTPITEEEEILAETFRNQQEENQNSQTDFDHFYGENFLDSQLDW